MNPHPVMTASGAASSTTPVIRQCECCNDNPATNKVNGWIESMSGIRSGLVAKIDRNTFYAFSGEICSNCDHDYMMKESRA